MGNRENAIENHNVTYRSVKKCKRGHDSERYTSTGQCVECLKQHSHALKSARRTARIRKNLDSINQIVETVVLCSVARQDAINSLNDIMRENGHRADQLEQFILMLGTSTLTTNDLRTILQSQDGYKTITNHGDYPMRHNEEGMLEMSIRGEWYLAEEVADCVRGHRMTVLRVLT